MMNLHIMSHVQSFMGLDVRGLPVRATASSTRSEGEGMVAWEARRVGVGDKELKAVKMNKGGKLINHNIPQVGQWTHKRI